MREARTNRALIIHMGADSHQSLQAQSAHRTDALSQVDGVAGCAAGLRFLAGFVDLQQHPDRNAAHGGTTGDLLGQLNRIHRFDGVHYRQHFTDFVSLQLADEMERNMRCSCGIGRVSLSGINHA